MQAKLPDINAAIVRYRNHALVCFSMNDYTGAELALGSINALMPDQYKVKVDTDKYYEAITEQKVIKCDYCKEDNQYDGIKTFKRRLTNMEQFLKTFRNGVTILTYEDKEYDQVWLCPKCKKENLFDYNKQVKEIVWEKPYYLGIVPEAPKKKNGILDRSSFPVEFNKWFRIAVHEIESKIGKYRAEFASQNPDGFDEFGKEEIDGTS